MKKKCPVVNLAVCCTRRSEKSCVRVRVSNIDPLMQKSVTVIGGTVSPDLYPHPFFMVGDDCRSGTFQLKKDTDSLGGKTEFEISLEKVSLVCVLLRPPDKLQEAVNRRLAINFNPFNKDLTSMSSMYTARNLKPLRLAFQIFVTDYNDVTAPTSAAVYSEEIYDYSKSRSSAGSVRFAPELIRSAWHSRYLVLFLMHLYLHLIVAEKPDLTNLFQSTNERLKCQLQAVGSRSRSHRFSASAYPALDAFNLVLHISNCPAASGGLQPRREMLSFHNLELSSCPKLEVIDQPTKYHRFRYESEVAKGTQGGYLYSRCADGKSPVRLRLSGLDVLAYRSVLDPSQVDYAKQKKYQKPIRLAFQAFYIDSNNTMIATGAMVATEEIAAKTVV
uniref:RHD domain-containing protein n=1 Tax=Macrostomum lignano TaxID=282301 RepID=A0A1I8F370_9PLAT